MATAQNSFQLPLTFNQVVELIRQLPFEQKRKLVNVLKKDEEALRRLFADGDASGEAPDCFTPEMLRKGVYFGVWEGQSLAAAAGTHLLEPSEGVGAIGNVYTRRDRRGLGLATAVTGAVTAELMRRELSVIVLNVNNGNAAARRVYERLGFRRVCLYHEGIAVGQPIR